MIDKKDYYGTKRVTAWPEARDGIAGYAVMYADGYVSWSPPTAFEAAYKPIDAMDFSGALQAMKDGHKVSRAAWTAPPGMFTDMFEGRIRCVPRDGSTPGSLLGFNGSDLIADDWMIVE